MRRVVFLPAWLAALLIAGPALPGRTLTSADGRTIEAEVLGFEGLEKVRIKRTDTAQTFTLPIDTFSEADRQSLRTEAAEAAAKPAPLQKGDVAIELSRLRFDSRKTKEDVPVVGGGVIRDAITNVDEDWGYTLTLKNNTAKPIENLRAEYFLYIKVDAPKNGSEKPRVRRQKFSLALEPIPAQGRLSARSDAVTARKTELKEGVVWAGTNDTKTRDSLEGIWLRLYQGDNLVLESASPPSLAIAGTWTGDVE
jgi:hypothetical protein